jgi:hypothetical protein
MPNISNKIIAVIIAMLIIMSAAIVVLINQKVPPANSDLAESNAQLSAQLENLTDEYQRLKENFTEQMNYYWADLNPNIVTRLGTKLIPDDDGNHLWATGEVENNGNVTAYNVRLRITLYTDRSEEVKTYWVGDMEPHAVYDQRYILYWANGLIRNYTIEPLATYQP